MWWIWLVAILAALIISILVVPAKILISFEDNDFNVLLKVLFVKKLLYPRPKAKSTKTQKPSKQKKSSNVKKSSSSKKKRSVIDLIKGLSEVAKVFLSKLRTNLHIRLRKLRIEVGAEDAANTAMIYAGVCNAYNELDVILNEFLKYKVDANAVDLSANFCSAKIQADVSIELSLNLILALKIAIPTLIKYVEKR